ncbi:hypothetical protein [Jiella mangrovi]|uniref:Uncharacterized protein n=1 Tax=Jiella mangrovi TaxID=2821407 RepID=A0ABS4BLQ8_9HYPH|nr:hypothetical protein [Jiella mangrovi]MBP0617653.1 hypothetical protein [Jiella mangrovi]
MDEYDMTILPNDHSVRDDMNCGAIIGRADLSDDVVVDAIKDRLASCNRSVEQADSIVSAALSGDAEAVSFLRTIQVPAPTVRLSMPPQALTRGEQRRGLSLSQFRFSWTRG